MFMFSRKKSTNKLRNACTKSQTNPTNPSDVFAMFGPTLKSTWDEFVKGENYAVEVFEQYSQYKAKMKTKYADIDFNRILTSVNDSDISLPLTVGHGIYLKLLDIKDDIFLSSETDSESTVSLSISEYKSILSKLNVREITYGKELKEYIDKNIKPLVESVSHRRYGINICKHTIPFNTLECIKYHRYLAEENYFVSNNDNIKWNRISNAPIFDYRITKENPLIPINIKYIDVFVLDYLCYATISLPSLDLDKILRYKDESSGDTILQALIHTFGDGIDKYIERAVVDMNCSSFRSFVRNGLKIS